MGHVKQGGFQECLHKVTYVDLLVDHMPRWMELWCDLLGFGYGFFTGTSGKHLNKVVKTLEMQHSNFSELRFKQVIEHGRIKVFHFPKMNLDDTAHDQTCYRYNQKGHNEQNETRPLHPTHRPPIHSDSEGEL